MPAGKAPAQVWKILATVVLSCLGACSGFGPSTAEDDDVGSKTNWLVSCSSDTECGGELSCICGTCSRYCSGPDDCGDGATCPVSRGAFQLACPQLVVGGEEASCRAVCSANEGCGAGGICVDGVCSQPKVEPCPTASELVWDSQPGMLQGRVGSLLGSGFYVPGESRVGNDSAYQPAELAVRVLNSDGQPVDGCEIVLVTEEASGYAYAQTTKSDSEGRVSFLWVAGAGVEQEVQPHVLTAEGSWLSLNASGEARRHDEEPLSEEMSPVRSTRATALGLSYPASEAGQSVRVRFAPLTFPPSAIYGPLTTSGLELWLVNGSTESASPGELPDYQRYGFFRAQGSGTLSGSVLFSTSPESCNSNGMDMVCDERGAWSLNEERTWQIDIRHVANDEVVTDYDFGVPPACEGDGGCTDYSISLIRSDATRELRAIMRSPLVDDLSQRGAFIDSDFSDQTAFAPSCLQTPQSSYFVAHEILDAEDWVAHLGAELEASPFGFRGEVCANYAAYAQDGGYYLSTGGPSPVGTPHLPDGSLQLD